MNTKSILIFKVIHKFLKNQVYQYPINYLHPQKLFKYSIEDYQLEQYPSQSQNHPFRLFRWKQHRIILLSNQLTNNSIIISYYQLKIMQFIEMLGSENYQLGQYFHTKQNGHQQQQILEYDKSDPLRMKLSPKNIYEEFPNDINGQENISQNYINEYLGEQSRQRRIKNPLIILANYIGNISNIIFIKIIRNNQHNSLYQYIYIYLTEVVKPLSRFECNFYNLVKSINNQSQYYILNIKNKMIVNSKQSSLKKNQKSARITPNTSFVKTNQGIIKKISGSIPVSVIPKTVYINSNDILKSKSKGQIEAANPDNRQVASQHHSRKISINNSRKQSIVLDNNSKTNSRDKVNRSNSSLSKNQKPEKQKQSFHIDISKIVQKEIHNNVDNQISKNHFIYHYVIGKGGFGKVWSVQLKKSKQIYAMKQMLKVKIISKKSINSVMNQRILLSNLKHPFIVNMNYAFQDREYLYLVMDLLSGGDLRYHIGRRRKFKQTQARFFIACIIIGLQYLHLHNIIHRDIKPENLVMDQKGYLRITDLGIARLLKPNNNADTSGTPGYMAPQVMCRQDHSFPVDYYAVGVIAYEFMLGKRPYFGRNRKQIRDQILAKQVQVRQQQLPQGWSLASLDFVNRMIQRKPTNRLGTNGITQIKEHAWFKGFSWTKLLKKQIASPFIPKPISQNQDYRQQISQSSQDEMQAENQLLLRRKSVEDLFQGYSFEKNDQKKGSKNSTTYTRASDQKDLKIMIKKNNFLV